MKQHKINEHKQNDGFGQVQPATIQKNKPDKFVDWDDWENEME